MKLFMPTKVYSEEGCVRKHAKEIAAYGKKAMIITGKHSAKVTGAYDDVVSALQQEAVSYIVFDEVEENPSVETVMKARKIGLDNNVDFVIGIGGGSPLDASKAIALMMTNPDKTEDVLYKNEVLPCMPIVCVPTTCGTGSEATQYSILTLHDQRTKRSISHTLFPELSLLDSRYLRTMSRECLVNTCVDALAHLVESYFNTNASELSRIYSREGLRIWSKFKDSLKNGNVSAEDYEDMIHASMIAGIAIAHTGTSVPHGMSYSITYERKIPHGKAVGMFLGGYVDFYKEKKDVKVVLDILGFDTASDLRQYIRGLLGVVEIEDELLVADAKGLLENPAKLKNYPYEISEQDLIEMAN
ncbi:MAG: iron-containing alcohol dehydrogenase [Lachnospiraceae bacterium]|nr:iron-containing alcohol dehydrogenase [Lachnospiraceae bacterium]